MTKFENYLTGIGYVKYRLNAKKMIFIPEKKNIHKISSMGNIGYYYFPDNIKATTDNVDKAIIFGLSERFKPPTLIYPRPRIMYKKPNGIIYNENNGDDAINIVLIKYSSEKIYNYIMDRKKCFYI